MGSDRKVAAAQMPTAFGRSAGVNSTVSAEIAMTITAAPASPSATRAARNCPEVVEYAHATDPAANSARPMARTRLWP